MSYHKNTICLYGSQKQIDSGHKGAISYPIYQSATFSHPGVGKSTGYDYSRLQNPTREHVEYILASLEHGCDAIAFSSGMAATSALMEFFEPGDHLICSEDLYGGTIRLFENINKKNGLSVTYIDTTDTQNIEKAICKETKAIYIETPSNPMMSITDIKQSVALARKHNLLCIVDNTFLSPYYQNPLTLGADIVLHSGTKFLCGHNDTLAGFLVFANKALAEKGRFIAKTTGAGLSAFDSFLILRGIKTLSVRMNQQQKNALKIADWLSSHPKVQNVYYIGLPEHPGFLINQKQSSGFGSMLSFRVDSAETAIHLLSSLEVIYYAESLGGVESLITYPMMQTHADVPCEERERKGINETLLRLSVGIEDADDLICDLSQALS